MYQLKYGMGNLDFDLPDELEVEVIEKNNNVSKKMDEKKLIVNALDNPIASRPMENIFKNGETVCMIVPDVTRLWQKPHVYVPIIIEKLNSCGIKDEDILIISAIGSHRQQSDEELKKIVTEEVFNRIEVVNHNPKANLEYIGTSSYMNDIYVNERVLQCDHVFLTGGIVYHFLAGFSGGRKSILPGIAGYDTIMSNHRFSFNEGLGSGLNRNVTVGSMSNLNPIHMDMMEAAEMVNPSFILNIAVSQGRIASAFAGHYKSAHKQGCDYVEKMDGIAIREKLDCVIASPGGSPMDDSLYQTFKSILNGSLALKKGGKLIIPSKCSEGIGSGDLENLLLNYKSNNERELFVRENYTIGKGIALQLCLLAEEFDIILVSDIDPKLFKYTAFTIVDNIEESLQMLDGVTIGILPNGTNCVPVISN